MEEYENKSKEWRDELRCDLLQLCEAVQMFECVLDSKVVEAQFCEMKTRTLQRILDYMTQHAEAVVQNARLLMRTDEQV